jgi:hypothetical protein
MKGMMVVVSKVKECGFDYLCIIQIDYFLIYKKQYKRIKLLVKTGKLYSDFKFSRLRRESE